MACAKSVGENLSTVAVGWAAMVRILIRSRVPSYIFDFSPTLSKETFNCPRGESELVESSLIFYLSAEPSLCRLGRHCPRCWKGIGAYILLADRCFSWAALIQNHIACQKSTSKYRSVHSDTKYVVYSIRLLHASFGNGMGQMCRL